MDGLSSPLWDKNNVIGLDAGVKGPSQKYLEANEVKYCSLGGGGGRRFHGHYFTLKKKNLLHACVYHYRMKPKVGRNFTSERGGRGSREK